MARLFLWAPMEHLVGRTFRHRAGTPFQAAPRAFDDVEFEGFSKFFPAAKVLLASRRVQLENELWIRYILCQNNLIPLSTA
ncbi:MAG: hypothetical protein LBI39_00205 [Puniceicoccales bacterium]|nr:hypothetical protein [Puniceicoccales bacterium]